MTCIFELLKLSKYVRNKTRLKQVVAPVLFIHSQEDDLTSLKSANVVYKNISSTRVRQCLFHLTQLGDELRELLPPELENLPSEVLLME